MAKVGAPKVKEPREDFGDKVKAHVRYKLADGTNVPGVTTVIGMLGSPALVPWANRLGLEGIDSRKFVDESGRVGTLAHYLVERELAGEEPKLDDFTPDQIKRAGYSVAAFHKWSEGKELVPILVEGSLISEAHRFGGTVDFFGLVNGKPELVDFKTSSAIYRNHKVQVAAYLKLLIEHNHTVFGVRIIRLGRVPTPDGEDIPPTEEHILGSAELRAYWRIFEHCLGIYQAEKALKDMT